jgi:AcrR family transcriptional regulator
MGRGRAANYEEQRAAILAQAAALFARQGYSATAMNQVAAACGLSKATLYHYFEDKYALLFCICETHVSQLAAIVKEAAAKPLRPEQRLRELISRVVAEYAGAQHAHRVLTEDVKFLNETDRQQVLDQERAVVQGFADAVSALRPELAEAAMSKPLTMLLFGMINWLFTWMRPEAALSYADMAQLVEDLFIGGLATVQTRPAAPGA